MVRFGLFGSLDHSVWLVQTILYITNYFLYITRSILNQFVRFDLFYQTECLKSERTERNMVRISKPNTDCNRTISKCVEIRTFGFQTFTVNNFTQVGGSHFFNTMYVKIVQQLRTKIVVIGLIRTHLGNFKTLKIKDGGV